MWAERDEFHLVWKKMSGDFIVRARARFLGDGVDPHRKMGWIARTSLDTSSAYVDAALHGDGLTSLQFRRTTGAITEQIESVEMAPDVVQLERRGSTYIMSVAYFGQPFVTNQVMDIDLGDELYVGLFVCSHNPDVVERAVFSDVRITVPAATDFVPYQDYIGSRLETLEVDTGGRTVLHTSTGAMQAPNWTPDGNALIYNEDGLIHRFDLQRGTSSVINTDFATNNNNDHVLSFDGATLAISHHSEDHDGASMIYTLPVEGGTPKLVTRLGPSYLHGWSPDGKWLTYTGGRNDEYDIYKIPSVGGDEVQLTTAVGLDDGPEYSPDGAFIYFNSTRSGTMELWRMSPDGANLEQLTDDAFNNWFPHVSPDGRRIAFLSYLPDVAPADHPWYKHVYLRMMDAEGGEPEIIAYVYGGQGTINVPSWSPDGNRVAFVSNTHIEKAAP